MSTLGRDYEDGEYIIRQGELGDKMYVIQDGEVEVVLENEQGDLVAATLGKEEIIGEMALFDQEVRSASVRAKGKVRVLAVDRKNLFARISENPTLAFRLIRTLCTRVRSLDQELASVKTQLGSRTERKAGD
ncbi:MAG TPA: cyclic nucleotide-binding domain-containing protein [Candidatus Krumholzibacteria bacterium]|nr:cyclic nucleotide-binding domain-containing protein [Candidatus Krumholzibacteria bacterium]